MRICLIASSRFPIAEPFAGGLEAHTSTLAHALLARGHTVSVFAAPGSDPALRSHDLAVRPFVPSAAARADVGAPPLTAMEEHHAYLGLMLDLARDGHERFDVVHHNGLHHLPVAMASTLRVPLVTTLHTPPLPWLESAIQLDAGRSAFVSVSRHTRAAWAHAVDSVVVPNGVDTDRWRPGPGGDRAVWLGRLVPEKAPHLAILAARRAGLPIDLVGPVQDADYVRREVQPLLDGVHARHLGHLGGPALVDLVGRAAVAVVSPTWEEPYGLVAAEAMSCGTPVAAFDRGAPREVVGGAGAVAASDDVDALARAVVEATARDRAEVRAAAVARCSVDTMVQGYLDRYAALLPHEEAA